jgi:hypothetical protein
VQDGELLLQREDVSKSTQVRCTHALSCMTHTVNQWPTDVPVANRGRLCQGFLVGVELSHCRVQARSRDDDIQTATVQFAIDCKVAFKNAPQTLLEVARALAHSTSHLSLAILMFVCDSTATASTRLKLCCRWAAMYTTEKHELSTCYFRGTPAQ